MAAATTPSPTTVSGTATATSDTLYFHPLTTIFTPPTSCLTAIFTAFTSSTGNVGFSTAWRDRNETSSDCYPYSFSAYQFYWTWYSPGVCPSGYTEAQTSKASTDTRAWCCPTGFTISGSGIYQYCSSYVASSTSVLSARTTLPNGDLAGFYTVPDAANYIALQWPLSVAWKDSDLSLFTPASAPVLTSTPSQSTASSTSTSTQAASTDLSTGAKAGIGVGAGVAVLLIIAGILLLCLRRRRKSKREEAAPPYTDTKHHNLLENRTPMYEMEANAPVKYELEATTRASELESPVSPPHHHRPGAAF